MARVQGLERRHGWYCLASNAPGERLAPALEWYFDQTPVLLTPARVWHFARYAGAAAAAMRPFWEASVGWYCQGQVTNLLWSAGWRALELLSAALRLCYALGALPRAERETRPHLLLALLQQYSEATTGMSVLLECSRQQRGQGPSMWVGCWRGPDAPAPPDGLFRREGVLAAQAQEALAKHGNGPEARQALDELEAALAAAEATPFRPPAVPLLTYEAEEDLVYHHVLGTLLRQTYLTDACAGQDADGTPAIPPPPRPFAPPAEKWAYYQAYVNAHPTEFAPPGVLNLAPTLGALAEYPGQGAAALLSRPADTDYAKLLHAMAQEPAFTALPPRAYAPASLPSVRFYQPYRRYEPYRQYPEPAGSWGQQLGLQLTRVCFNATRDIGLFFYNLDYHTHILSQVALVHKHAGCWLLLEAD
ncbi:hypothetical protein [Hymenobacter sp. BT491]|uniref:hypothetical protein n=1 Tax=Hymenobacter sp. BT491 TaxID=2766779 RepID=UPI0016536642|nr:hypothetical protein [Hymenobacter sp. BT491]MBC6992245.1 hypothetical protein [Hymenobacter sp. BT491]